MAGACDDCMRRAWLPVLPTDRVDVVLQVKEEKKDQSYR